MRRAALILIVIAVGAVLAVVVGGVTWRAVVEPRVAAASLQGLRDNAAYQFSASLRAAAFPLPLSDKTIALAFYDRISRQQFLIEQDNRRFSNPYLSPDGKRLVFVRSRLGDVISQMFSCEIDGWRCRELVRIDQTLHSPFELAPDTVIYASSPYVTGPDGKVRSARNNIYLSTIGSEPKQLTNFGIYQLDAISLSGTRLLLQATPFQNTKEFAKPDSNGSEIYEMQFDPARREVLPAEKLKPLEPIKGPLYKPSLSGDGKYMSFARRRNRPNEYHFDLAITSPDGSTRIIETKGTWFSRGAFIGDQVIVNEFVDDEYRMRSFDLTTGASELIHKLNTSPQTLKELKRIDLALEP